MSRTERLAAVGGLGAGAVAIGLAGLLLQRTLGTVLEIGRYTEDILGAAGGLRAATNLAAEFGDLKAATGRVRAATAGTVTTEAPR